MLICVICVICGFLSAPLRYFLGALGVNLAIPEAATSATMLEADVQKLVECIPNFSEGRREGVIRAIVEAIASVDGVMILDRHSDPDHNRTVVTFVGAPRAVEEAAFRGIAKAAELIDLNHHTGEHPRIGAADVVPFVPLRGVSMAECVEMARRLGKRVGDELGIPVYLYEKAATRPERERLENIRRGQYEALKEEIGKNPDRDPDFGPKRVGPAGATVIGARGPLIAYNVYLTTDEVAIAKKIARAVRHSSGGLRYVKALGMLVGGRAQVSMNLTDYRKTPIARVVELIRREAARYGTAVHHSELVGLAPEEALTDAARWYLQLDQFDPDRQILERRLYAVLAEQAVLQEQAAFLDDLASDASALGGGAASAYAAAEAAALVTKAGRLMLGKKNYKAIEPRVRSIVERAEELRAAFVKSLTAANAKSLLRTAERAVEVVRLAREIASIDSAEAIAAAGTAAVLARAAVLGASVQIRASAGDLPEDEAAELAAAIRRLLAEAEEIYAQTMSTVEERGGFVG